MILCDYCGSDTNGTPLSVAQAGQTHQFCDSRCRDRFQSGTTSR